MADSVFLIAGLGNPGDKYRDTRHNMGFAVVDLLAKRWGVAAFQNKFRSEVAQASRAGQSVLLLKPQTFMNLSGDAVGEAVRFYKVPVVTQLLVIIDEIDLPLGTLRLRTAGGSGGHNGLKSIIEVLNTEEFPRLRVGIGRSDKASAASHVLGKIDSQERQIYETLIESAANAVELCIKQGVALAMNTVNLRSEPK